MAMTSLPVFFARADCILVMCKRSNAWAIALSKALSFDFYSFLDALNNCGVIYINVLCYF